MITERRGFEVWRLVARDMEPQVAGRRLAMMETLMDPVFDDKKPLDSMLAWETEIKRFEEVIGKTFDPEWKIAVLAKKMPWEVRQHLHLHVGEFDDYHKVRDMVMGFLRARQDDPEVRGRGVQRPQPMEVDSLQNKGQGKTGGVWQTPWQTL